jgi:hypothetical protein
VVVMVKCCSGEVRLTQVLLQRFHTVRQHIQVLISTTDLTLCILKLLLQLRNLPYHGSIPQGHTPNQRMG